VYGDIMRMTFVKVSMSARSQSMSSRYAKKGCKYFTAPHSVQSPANCNSREFVDIARIPSHKKKLRKCNYQDKEKNEYVKQHIKNSYFQKNEKIDE
jgi:hypothetical protein